MAHGCLVELVQGSGFLGGISYQLVANGSIKDQSSDLTYMSNLFEKY
jgi:hypothetical protein